MFGHSSGAAYRWVAVIAAFLAMSGWGSYFYVSESRASLAEAQRLRISRLEQERGRLEGAIKALKEQGAQAAELTSVETKLATARENLARTTEAQEQAKSALAAASTELASRRVELSNLTQQASRLKEEQVSDTGTVEREKPAKRKRYYAKRHKKKRSA